MAARKPPSAFRMSDEHRTKIANSQILKCLIEHALGKRKMGSTQVTAALGLLKKVLPDLNSVEHSGELEQTYIARMPAPVKDLDEWRQRYAPSIQ